MNGFQLVPLAAPAITGPTNQAVIAGQDATLSASVTGLPAPALQWLVNDTPLAGETGSTLVCRSSVFPGWLRLFAGGQQCAGAATNSMVLTVIVTPAITGLTNQAAASQRCHPRRHRHRCPGAGSSVAKGRDQHRRRHQHFVVHPQCPGFR